MCIKRFWLLSLCASLACYAAGHATEDSETEVSKFLRHLDVIPDVLDMGPQEFLNVTYAGNIRADRGVELQPMQVRDKPTVNWIAGKDNYYTLIMVDSDWPNKEHPKRTEFLHWLVVNIPGSKLEMGDVRASYVGAMPPKKSGLHRYVLLLYKQSEHMMFDFDKVPNHSDQGRTAFSTKQFAKLYKLKVPLAGNFFTSSWSSDVPALHKAIMPGEIKT
ncbi:CG17917 [Drosophila busckii]|uniref:CG17917 n=1 Tax=Drosophila busckii TaxID=30019 RepID=A0A0M4EPM2_DROBS|nr:putative odorant-binding protein A5 [Drosophila busckii]ALC46814.1 CG17917 [Drosophila busckii]